MGDRARETAGSRSRIATTKSRRGGRRSPPVAFREHGAVMLASVLNGTTAVEASIQIVRAFVRLREILATHRDLARKVAALERKYDARFSFVFSAIRELMEPPDPRRRRIGFTGQSGT
jgi:phage regulator Rha-like protein